MHGRNAMRVGIISVFVDYHRNGAHHRGFLQPQIGPLIAGLLPSDIEIEVINDTWEDPDWSRVYDLLFISGMHSDFDRARQISHYWEVVRQYYAAFESDIRSGTADVYRHAMPGGQYTNLRAFNTHVT